MIDFTAIARKVMAPRVNEAARWSTLEGTENVQREVLSRLLHSARGTEIGLRLGFRYFRNYDDFSSHVSPVEYEDIRNDVMRMVKGERNILWPGRCTNFAQSSGTSGGKSKFIPITADSLRLNHYAGTRYTVAFYLDLYRESHLFGGRCFILGGSFANELDEVGKGIRVGDLSATLIDKMPRIGEIMRVPSRKVALMSDWSEKLPALVQGSIHHNITNISGVPSWFLTVLRNVLDAAGATSIHDVWPNLEVFFHGGIAFGPYRKQYEAITDPSRMRYLETYNASEGFFAAADSIESPGMRLLLNTGMFYEFIDESGNILPAWRVEQGKVYELMITGCNGLWRYRIGDTVRIESVEPLRITIAGRTKSFINAFGEEVMEHNANAAIAAACEETDASVADYTAAPVYAEGKSKGRHQWLIEWRREPSGGTDAFAAALDRHLAAVNSDYQAKRAGNIFLDPPEIITLPRGTFDSWLASTGKLGGQRKVPRLRNDRSVADAILSATQHIIIS